MRSFGRYEITAPIDGVFTVRETLNLEKPSEVEQGAPLATAFAAISALISSRWAAPIFLVPFPGAVPQGFVSPGLLLHP